MTPIVFWASLLPCPTLYSAEETSWNRRDQMFTRPWRTFRFGAEPDLGGAGRYLDQGRYSSSSTGRRTARSRKSRICARRAPQC